MANINTNARLTVTERQRIAAEAKRAAVLTMDIIEKVRTYIGNHEVTTFLRLAEELFGYDGVHFEMTRDAMRESTYFGPQQWDPDRAPIGSVQWFHGWAGLDLGPIGLLTVGAGTDGFLHENVGLVPRTKIGFLGWSLDFAECGPLVAEQIVFRGEE